MQTFWDTFAETLGVNVTNGNIYYQCRCLRPAVAEADEEIHSPGN